MRNKVFVKLGKSTAGTFQVVRVNFNYKGKAQGFSEGPKDIDDESCALCPPTFSSGSNVTRVKELQQADRPICREHSFNSHHV